MLQKTSRTVVIVFIILMLLIGMVQPAGVAAEVKLPPDQPQAKLVPHVGSAEKFDLSAPLSEMIKQAAQAPVGALQAPERRLMPKSAQTGLEEFAPLPASPVSSKMPAPLAGFEGVSNVNGVLPPDTNGDIGYDPATGKKWYMQWVNLSYNIWDVTNPAAPIQAYATPKAGNTLWTGFGGDCQNTNDGDPIVLFDQLAGRWNVSQFAVNGPYYQCIAISQTADPTGAWYRYAFQVSTTKMNDYPKLGVWPDGYYMTVNQFLNGASWSGAGAFVFERDKMLVGQAARFVYFDLYSVNSDFGGMLPSDADGALPPPVGAPNYFAEWDDSSWIGPADALRIWEFHVDWNTTANSTFGVNGQPNLVLNTQNVNLQSAGIPQPGTTVALDNLADRLMHRLQYRNYGAYQAMVTNHTVNAGSNRAGVHWWELRKTNGNWFIQNEGVHAPADTTHRWMASIALDASGNIGLGYSTSSSTLYPSIAYAGRLATDPANSLPQAEVTMKSGTGSQTHSAARWGDYSMMSVDPLDDCTFWYTTEFLTATSSASWRTWIGAFKFPSCSNTAFGELKGTVRESGTLAPISNAKVTVNGTDVFTDSAGAYTTFVATGTYSVTASAFSYTPQTVNGVVITGGGSTTQNFYLNHAPQVTVSGKVSDNTWHIGMPIYAKIEVAGLPGSPIFTDPFTGNYSVQLYQDTPYPFTVSAMQGGYGAPVARLVTPPAGGSTQNFNLSADLTSCGALGYAFTGGLGQSFEAGVLPAGWAVVDNLGNGQVWKFNDPGSRGNLTGGSGKFAIVDSDSYGGSGAQDTSLVSPAINLSGISTVTLTFKTDYKHGAVDTADVDVSINGGAWQNVWRRTSNASGTQTVNLSTLAGNQPNVKIRFHYYGGAWDWWWQVDDVLLGSPVCSKSNGGILAGYVKDGNTAGALNGAKVTSSLGEFYTAATPLDPALGDGFYLAFAPAGNSPITASMVGGYSNLVRTPLVTADAVARHDFNLAAGVLAFSPSSVTMALDANQTYTQTVVLQNTGSAAGAFTLTEASGLPLQPQVTGPFAMAGRRTSPKQLDALTGASVRIYEPPQVPAWDGGTILNAWQPRLANPWGIAVTKSGELWVSSAAKAGGDDLNHRFDRLGSPAGVSASIKDWVTAFAADMAYDLVSGKIWQVNVGGEGCIYEMDAAAAAFTGVKICPDFSHSIRGLAFDPLSRTFYGGSWVDGIVYHFDLNGTILDSKNLDLNLAGMAFNPATGHLFALSSAATGKDVYVLDARNGYAVLGGFDIWGMADFGQAGLEFSADGHLWAVDQLTSQVFEVTSGEENIYAFADVAWFSLNPVSGSVSAGVRQPIEVTFNTTGLAPGTYYAHVLVGENTPYAVAPLAITLTVDPTRGVDVTAPEAVKFGLAGVTLHYSLTVKNIGNVSDTFNIIVGTHIWPVSAPTSVGPLTPGATSAPIDVTITIPAVNNVAEHVIITVQSQSDYLKTDTVTLTARSGYILSMPMISK